MGEREELIERLCKRAEKMKSGGLYLRLGDYADEEAALDHEVADALAATHEEVERLRGAMREIVSLDHEYGPCPGMAEIARDALQQGGGE